VARRWALQLDPLLTDGGQAMPRGGIDDKDPLDSGPRLHRQAVKDRTRAGVSSVTCITIGFAR
jgi:hypothetical protein